MTRRHLALAVVLLMLLTTAVLVAACGSGEKGGGGGGDSAAVFKIGFDADLAVDEINAAGGVNGMKLQLIVKDNKNDKALAIQTTQELLDEGIQYLIATTADHVTAIARMAAESEIPSDTADGTAPNLPRD